MKLMYLCFNANDKKYFLFYVQGNINDDDFFIFSFFSV